jgi:ATP-binding cassette, subfamily B, multidrug efflux pump
MTESDNASGGATRAGALRIIARCLTLVRPYRWLVAGAYVMLLAITASALAVPQLIRIAVDRGIRAGDARTLGMAVLAFMAVILVKGVFTFVQGRWTEVASQGAAYNLRNTLHGKLSALSFSYHDRAEVGQLLSRSIQDVDRVRFLTGRATLRLAEGAVLLLATGVALFIMNRSLAALALGAMPLLAYRALAFGRRFRPLSLAIQQQLAVLTTRLEQNLRGARVVKAFAQEDAEIVRFAGENERWLALSTEATRLQAIHMPMLDLIANLGTIVIIWYGGWLVIHEALTLGELIAFTTYLSQLFMPVRRLGMILPAIAMAAAAGERVFEILDSEVEIRDAPDAYDLPSVSGHVRFEDVTFSYFGRHRILHNVSFEARPGQVIAILGAAGSGKSTIINLIPRFYDPASGRITLDGHDLRAITLKSLRDQVGIVLQETTLFVASVRENIAFGRPDASEEEIVEAARAAQAHDFIMALREGYASPVGERGITLSGGQRQRIAIARALLKDPRILVLDDATASVDAETERLIQAALKRLMQGRTSFVIAHRLGTVREADMILVLDQGRIAARGRHDELLRSSDLYAEIYFRQFLPQEPA